MQNKFVLVVLLFLSLSVKAQQPLTLQDCYSLVDKNYPLAKQTNLLNEKLNYDLTALKKDKLPKIDVNAQATYQSDVVGLPTPMPGVIPLNKDQYRATLDANQLIYNGGLIDANIKLKEAQTSTQQQQTLVNLYALKNSINQYYFSILLLHEKKELLLAKKNVLVSKIKEVKSGVKFGAILPSSEQVLEAETIRIEQNLIEIDFEAAKLFNNLSNLTGTVISTNSTLVKPQFNSSNETTLRPEIVLFDSQLKQLEVSKNIISKSLLPKITAFGQLGYGNPGLNMLDNSFQTFYVFGLKANWNVFDWGKNTTNKKAIDISKDLVQTEKETFELNNKTQLEAQDFEIKKAENLLLSDAKIIKLRESILKSADAQLKNGVITSSEYIVELTNLFEAKSTLTTHEVQAAAAKANYEIIKGK